MLPIDLRCSYVLSIDSHACVPARRATFEGWGSETACCSVAQGAPRRTSSAQPAQQYAAYGYQPQAYGYAMVGGYDRGRGGRLPGRPPGPPGPAAGPGPYGMMARGPRPAARFGLQPMPMPGYMPGYPMAMGMMDRPPPPGTPGISSGLQVRHWFFSCLNSKLLPPSIPNDVAELQRIL